MLGSVEGNGNTPIVEGMRAAEILQAMRVNGASDLEVSFVAMRFIIQSAINLVNKAIEDSFAHAF